MYTPTVPVVLHPTVYRDYFDEAIRVLMASELLSGLPVRLVVLKSAPSIFHTHRIRSTTWRSEMVPVLRLGDVAKRLSTEAKQSVVISILLVNFIPFVFGGVIDYNSGETTDVPRSYNSTRLAMAGTPVVIAATAKHTATLIFLHGLGDTGHGWASAMGAVRSPFVKVICPTAQTMPVTLNSGFKMPAWFDLRSLDPNGPEDEAGIKKASLLIHSMIDSEISAGIPSNRILIGGFSQGGALALYSALTYAKPLAGVVALSCWLPLNKNFPDWVVGNKETPFLQCHGDCDPIVPFKWGQMTASLLRTFLKSTEFKTYGGLMHSSSDEEMKDIKDFVQKYLQSV